MKNIKKVLGRAFMLGFVLMGSIMLPFACRQDKITVDESLSVDTKLPSILREGEELLWNNFPLPAMTTISQGNVNGKSIATFTFPEGVKFVIKNQGGIISFSERGCYQCESDCSRGCDVVKLGDQVGCSSCPANDKSPCTGSHCRGGNGIGHGFIDLKAGIEFITKDNKDKTRFLSTPNWDILSQVPEVAKALEALNLKYYGTKNPTLTMTNGAKKGYKINLFGSPAVYYIPNAYFERLSTAQARLESSQVEEAGDDVSCECLRGSGCKKESVKTTIGITVGTKCVAGGCDNCRMTW